MARPSAHVITSADIGDLIVDILDAPGAYYVTYRGEPISVRVSRWTGLGLKHTYNRTGFNQPQHCHRLAAKLNKDFNSTEFGVREFISGR